MKKIEAFCVFESFWQRNAFISWKGMRNFFFSFYCSCCSYYHMVFTSGNHFVRLLVLFFLLKKIIYFVRLFEACSINRPQSNIWNKKWLKKWKKCHFQLKRFRNLLNFFFERSRKLRLRVMERTCLLLVFTAVFTKCLCSKMCNWKCKQKWSNLSPTNTHTRTHKFNMG